MRFDPRKPVLSEVQLFDVRRPASPFRHAAEEAWHGLSRGPFGLRPDLLARAGVVVEPPGAPFQRTWISRHLFAGARACFYALGHRPLVTLAAAPALFHATQPLPLRVRGCPNIVTIHDLVPLRLPYLTLDNKRYMFRLLTELAARADHIVTVSEHSRRDIMQFFGVPEQRITNTWQASALPARLLARPEAEAAEDVANLFELEPGGYFLFLGALEPKKNVLRLIDAYATSGSRRPLVIAGGAGWQNERELERIRDDRFFSYRLSRGSIAPYKRVRRIAYLPLEQMVALVRSARALLFPSLYEGFGLPVLEAMMLGTPVLTSDITSLPEVAGDAALLVDPYDVAAIARGIRALDADADLCQALAAKGLARAAFFSMEQYAERLGALYRMMLGQQETGSVSATVPITAPGPPPSTAPRAPAGIRAAPCGR
jgi:glycosyltransferase involved in cell wall biosynthesis